MRPDKNEKILTAAIKLFGKQGFDNTSTQAISREAGIGTGTLFKYYGTKKELIIAAYTEAKMTMIEAMKRGLDPTLEFEGLMYHIWDRCIDWSLSNPQEHKFMMQVKSSRLADSTTTEKIRQEFIFLFVAIKAAQDSGKIADLPQELIEQNITNFINLAVSYISNSEVDKNKTKKQLFRMMIKSIRPE